MIRTCQNQDYDITAMRNAEEFLTDLDLVYHSAVKLDREFRATITVSGPEGYPNHSSCRAGISTKSSVSADRTFERMDELCARYRKLTNMLQVLKKDLSLIRGTRSYKLLHCRFKKGKSAGQTAKELNCSERTYYRLRKQALSFICSSLEKTEMGRQVLQQGSAAAIHKYFK